MHEGMEYDEFRLAETILSTAISDMVLLMARGAISGGHPEKGLSNAEATRAELWRTYPAYRRQALLDRPDTVLSDLPNASEVLDSLNNL